MTKKTHFVRNTPFLRSYRIYVYTQCIKCYMFERLDKASVSGLLCTTLHFIWRLCWSQSYCLLFCINDCHTTSKYQSVLYLLTNHRPVQHTYTCRKIKHTCAYTIKICLCTIENVALGRGLNTALCFASCYMQYFL